MSIVAVTPLAVHLPRLQSSNIVIVLVDGELWTDESVFWQNKLQDRRHYEVVYRNFLSLLFELILLGKPWFFQVLQKRQDRKNGVTWDSGLPRRSALGEPPKVKLIAGPCRFRDELYLPPEYGSNWGRRDPRHGTPIIEVRSREEPPPPYLKHVELRGHHAVQPSDMDAR